MGAFDDITGRWDYGTLGDAVHVGSGCFLERRESFARMRSSRKPAVILGNRVRVYTWSAFSLEQHGQIQVGDDSILIGALFMCAHRIVVGARVRISYNVIIADSDFHPVDPQLRELDASAIAPPGDLARRPGFPSLTVVIGDDACIGIGAMILKGVTIGRGAVVAAGAVVTDNVRDGAFVAGNPGRER